MDRYRIMVSMKPDQIRALDDFSACCKKTNGRKLSRACIIRALTRVAAELDINVDGVRSEEEFEQRIREAITRCDE